MKKIIFILILCFMLMPGIVNAEYFPGVEMPSDVYTLDNKGTSSSDGHYASFIDDYNWYYNYYQLYAYNYQNNGIFVNFSLNQVITKDSRYVIQVYFNGLDGMKQGNFSSGVAPVNYINSDPFNYTNQVNLNSFICETTTAYISTQTDTQLTVCTVDFIYTGPHQPKFLSIPINSTVSGKGQLVQFLGYTIQNLGKDYSTDLNNIKTSMSDINKNIGNIKDDITNSINESSDKTNANITAMGDALTNTINDQFNNCRESVNLFDGNVESGAYSSTNGEKISKANSLRNANYILVSPNTDYIFSNDGVGIAMFVFEYDSNHSFITNTYIAANTSFKPQSNTKYINFYRISDNLSKLQLEKGSSITKYEPYGEKICSNRFDEQIANENKNHQETIDTITNADVDSDAISSLTSTQLPTTGVLSSILNMPIQFFNSLLNNLDTTTCKAVVIPIPFVDSTFTFPCVRSLLDELGALEFYNAIGSLVGGIALFNYTLYMGHQFKKMEDLEDGSGEFGGL